MYLVYTNLYVHITHVYIYIERERETYIYIYTYTHIICISPEVRSISTKCSGKNARISSCCPAAQLEPSILTFLYGMRAAEGADPSVKEGVTSDGGIHPRKNG